MPEVTPEFTQTRGQRHLSVHPPASERFSAGSRARCQSNRTYVRTYIHSGKRQTIHAATEARTRGRNLI